MTRGTSKLRRWSAKSSPVLDHILEEEKDDDGSRQQFNLRQYYLERKPHYLKTHPDAPVLLFIQNGRIEERLGKRDEQEMVFLERMEKEDPTIEEAEEIFLDTVRLKPATFSKQSRVLLRLEHVDGASQPRWVINDVQVFKSQPKLSTPGKPLKFIWDTACDITCIVEDQLENGGKSLRKVTKEVGCVNGKPADFRTACLRVPTVGGAPICKTFTIELEPKSDWSMNLLGQDFALDFRQLLRRDDGAFVDIGATEDLIPEMILPQ